MDVPDWLFDTAKGGMTGLLAGAGGVWALLTGKFAAKNRAQDRSLSNLQHQSQVHSEHLADIRQLAQAHDLSIGDLRQKISTVETELHDLDLKLRAVETDSISEIDLEREMKRTRDELGGRMEFIREQVCNLHDLLMQILVKKES